MFMFFCIFFKVSEAPISLMYIDPGTGSMLLTILMGLLSVGIYSFKSLFLKLYSFAGIKKNNTENNKFVIYTDSKIYWNTFKSICDEFEKRKIELTYLTQSEDDLVFNNNYQFIKPEYIGHDRKSFARLNNLKADILLSTTPSLDVFQWKRSKDVKHYIHIPHSHKDMTLYRVFGIDYYDSMLLSGEFQFPPIRELEEKRNLPAKELRAVGLTYFDELKKKVDNSRKTENEIPVILLAPSWGVNSILNKYGPLLIDPLIKTGYKIVVRPHPQSFVSEPELINNLIKQYPELEWNKDIDNFDILNRADLLISDFSGVMFDFAFVFDKPFIYTEYDFDDSPYDAHWVDEIPWTFRILPEIGHPLSESEFACIKSIIDDCMYNSKYSIARKKAIEETWINIGGSAEAITDYMIEKQKEITEEK